MPRSVADGRDPRRVDRRVAPLRGLGHLDHASARGVPAFNVDPFVGAEHTQFHLAIGQDDDAADTDEHVHQVDLRPLCGGQRRPALEMRVVGRAPPRGREAGIDQRGDAAPAIRFHERKLRPLRLPFGSKPMLDQPLTMKDPAAGRPLVIDGAAFPLDAVRTPDADRFGESSTPATLQHNVQVPHSRPATTRQAGLVAPLDDVSSE